MHPIETCSAASPSPPSSFLSLSSASAFHLAKVFRPRGKFSGREIAPLACNARGHARATDRGGRAAILHNLLAIIGSAHIAERVAFASRDLSMGWLAINDKRRRSVDSGRLRYFYVYVVLPKLRSDSARSSASLDSRRFRFMSPTCSSRPRDNEHRDTGGEIFYLTPDR